MNSNKPREVILRDNFGRQTIKIIDYPSKDYVIICDDKIGCIHVPKYLIDSLSKSLIGEG